MVFHTWHLQYLSFFPDVFPDILHVCVCVCCYKYLCLCRCVWESVVNPRRDSLGLESPSLVLEALSFLGQVEYACWPVNPREYAYLCLPYSVTTVTPPWTYSPGFWGLETNPPSHCKCFSLWALPRQCGWYLYSNFHCISRAFLNIFTVFIYFCYCYDIIILERT